MPKAMRPNIVTTYQVGDAPLSATSVTAGFFGGVGRLLAFLRPFETGMTGSVATWRALPNGNAVSLCGLVGTLRAHGRCGDHL